VLSWLQERNGRQFCPWSSLTRTRGTGGLLDRISIQFLVAEGRNRLFCELAQPRRSDLQRNFRPRSAIRRSCPPLYHFFSIDFPARERFGEYMCWLPVTFSRTEWSTASDTVFHTRLRSVVGRERSSADCRHTISFLPHRWRSTRHQSWVQKERCITPLAS
jgi:hypothetical protein